MSAPKQPMKELLTPELKRKPEFTSGHEAAALKTLVNFVNDPRMDPRFDPSKPLSQQKHLSSAPAFSEIPEEHIATPATSSPAPALLTGISPDTEAVLVEPAAIAAPVTVRPTFAAEKVFYTGRLAVGKDHIALQTGAKIFGFADPLYAIASHFFGVEVTSTQNKDLPGMRAFLQTVGQWGKNIISEDYPVTPARAAFVSMIRALAAQGNFSGYEVNWEEFGRDERIWTDALCARADAYEGRKTTTNVRFNVEFDRLEADGWTHFHVMCSPNTWARRLASKKLTPQSKEVADYSEHMAIKMDKGVLLQINKEPHGAKIRCIWNDDAPCPSPRLFTVDEFLEHYNAPRLTVTHE